MVSEYAPARLRATLVSLMYAAFPLGGVLGGPMSAAVIAVYGWQGVFLIGGVAPLIFAAVLAAALPEFATLHADTRPQRSEAIGRRDAPSRANGTKLVQAIGSRATTVD